MFDKLYQQGVKLREEKRAKAEQDYKLQFCTFKPDLTASARTGPKYPTRPRARTDREKSGEPNSNARYAGAALYSARPHYMNGRPASQKRADS